MRKLILLSVELQVDLAEDHSFTHLEMLVMTAPVSSTTPDFISVFVRRLKHQGQQQAQY